MEEQRLSILLTEKSAGTGFMTRLSHETYPRYTFILFLPGIPRLPGADPIH